MTKYELPLSVEEMAMIATSLEMAYQDISHYIAVTGDTEAVPQKALAQNLFKRFNSILNDTQQ